MPYAVYLDLDASGSREIARLMDAIEMCAADSATPRRLGHTHHVTLAVYDQIDVQVANRAISLLAAETAKIEIGFSVVGSFPSERSVLLAAPTVTSDLLEAHERYHSLAAQLGGGFQYYRPGFWFPHVTLALGLTREELSECATAVADIWMPFRCHLEAVRLVRLEPVETLHLHRLV